MECLQGTPKADKLIWLETKNFIVRLIISIRLFTKKKHLGLSLLCGKHNTRVWEKWQKPCRSREHSTLIRIYLLTLTTLVQWRCHTFQLYSERFCWSDHSDKIKREFFQAVTVSVLLYDWTTCTLTKRLAKKARWKIQKCAECFLEKILGAMPNKTTPISQTIQIRRTKIAPWCSLKLLDFDLKYNKFKLHLRYYVHFRRNTLLKVINSHIIPLRG